MINLEKGEKVELTKTNPKLSNILVGLGWDLPDLHKLGGPAFDLDVSACLLNELGKLENDADLVFYNNLRHKSGSVIHTGDNLTGAGDGDDEQIKIDLDLVPLYIEKIAFIVNIYNAKSRNQNFGMVKNAFIRIINEFNDEALVRYDLGPAYSEEPSVLIGELYRDDTEWKFRAVGQGLKDGLNYFRK